MKNLFLLLGLSLLFMTSCTNNDIVGQWEGKNYSDETIEFHFNKDGKAAMINGTEYNEASYKVDKNKDPYHLDLKIDKETTLKLIYKFTDDGRLVIGMEEEPTIRPTAFGGLEKQTLIFSRK